VQTRKGSTPNLRLGGDDNLGLIQKAFIAGGSPPAYQKNSKNVKTRAEKWTASSLGQVGNREPNESQKARQKVGSCKSTWAPTPDLGDRRKGKRHLLTENKTTKGGKGRKRGEMTP